MLDQPSQTQFPDSEDEDAEEEDVAAVTQAFQALGEGTRRANGKFQIIVTEHGGTKLWKNVSAAHDVERWRRGRSLIPWHWMPSVPSELSGKRADYALQDESVRIASQIRDKFGLSVSSSNLEIVKSAFEPRGIRFKIRVSVEDVQHQLDGLLATDLSMEIVQAVSA